MILTPEGSKIGRIYIVARKVNQIVTVNTVIILSFRTERSGQTVQTQIRLLIEEQSDQGLYCLLFHFTFLIKFPKVWHLCLNFR